MAGFLTTSKKFPSVKGCWCLELTDQCITVVTDGSLSHFFTTATSSLSLNFTSLLPLIYHGSAVCHENSTLCLNLSFQIKVKGRYEKSELENLAVSLQVSPKLFF